MSSRIISTTREVTGYGLDMELADWDLLQDKTSEEECMYWPSVYWDDEKMYICFLTGQIMDVTDDDIELRRRPHLTREDLDRELDEYMDRYQDLRQRLRDAVQRAGGACAVKSFMKGSKNWKCKF